MFKHILTHKSKVICHYIDLNFSVCKIIEFTLTGLSQVVNKRKPTEACRNGNRSSKPHYSLEALASPTPPKHPLLKAFSKNCQLA